MKTTLPPSRSEALARNLLKSFFRVDVPAPPMPQARQEAEMLVPLVPTLAGRQPMFKATLPVWPRTNPGVPQVRSAAISAKLVKERPRRTRVIWLRKAEPDDWKLELLRMVDAYETGRVQFHRAGLLCDGDWCWNSQLMSGR